MRIPKRRIANNGIHTVRDVVDDPLQYRLEIIEEDAENSDRVKVRYIGYSSKYDEWRTRNEIVELSGRKSAEINLEIRNQGRNLEISYALSEVSDPSARLDP